MGLELATYISQLDKTWPLSADLTSQGDDHFRLIKKVLQAQFPGAGGQGFSKAITANEDELNRLAGVSSNIQQQFDAIETIPYGTTMVFYQVSAPVGWTKVTTRNDYMLRVVSGSGGGSGGSESPITHTHATSGHALTIAEMPPHDHSLYRTRNCESGASYWQMVSRDNSSADITPSGITGSGASHSHGNTGAVSVKYIDTILCTKD